MVKRPAKPARKLQPARIGSVVDVEIALDADAFDLVADKSRGGYGRLALKQLVCASVLTFAEHGPEGEMEVLGLQTFHRGKLSEIEILDAIDASLPDPADDRTVLVSFNGLAHDLPLLKMRALKSWHFGLERLRGWDALSDRHVDLMLRIGGRRHSSLEDISALLGAGIRGRRNVSTNVAASYRARDWDPIMCRNQIDVAATFLAYGHERAWELGSSAPATTAWTSLSAFARALPNRGSHLAEFSHNALVPIARESRAAASA